MGRVEKTNVGCVVAMEVHAQGVWTQVRAIMTQTPFFRTAHVISRRVMAAQTRSRATTMNHRQLTTAPAWHLMSVACVGDWGLFSNAVAQTFLQGSAIVRAR